MENNLEHYDDSKIKKDIGDALERNIASGIGKRGIASVVRQKVDSSIQEDFADKKTYPKLEQIKNIEARQNIEEAFATSEKIFKMIGLTPPTPQDFTDAGVDFEDLAKGYHKSNPEKSFFWI